MSEPITFLAARWLSVDGDGVARVMLETSATENNAGRSNVPDKNAPAKKDESTTTKDGLFISRKQRRDAKAAAEAEVATNKAAADDADDAADRAAYEAKYPDRTDAEKVHNAEQAQAQATDEARERAGLDTTKSRKEKADADAKATEATRVAAEKAATADAQKADKA